MKKAPLWCVHRTQSGNFDDMVIVCDDLTSVVGMGWGEWGVTHTHTLDAHSECDYDYDGGDGCCVSGDGVMWWWCC